MRAAKGEGSAFKTTNGYRGYVTVNGKRKYFSAKTKAEAAQKKRALLAQRDGGELSTGRVPSVKAWLDHWLSIADHRDSTRVGYRYYIDHYIDPEIGGVKLDKLTLERLEQFYTKLEADGLSGSTRHQVHSILRVALKHAVWRGHIGRNVASLVKPPSSTAEKQETLSEADMRVILAAAVNDPHEARWHLSLRFGLRPGEAIAVEWSHIDFEKQTLHVCQQLQHIRGEGLKLIPLPKTDAGDRVLHLPVSIVNLLLKRRQEQMVEMIQEGEKWTPWEYAGKPRALVFTQRNGDPVRPRLDTTNWKKLLERAGIPHTRRYTSRHTAASVMIANDVDVATVAETLGHSSPAFTLSTYVHAVDERKRELADKLDQIAAGDKVQDKVQE